MTHIPMKYTDPKAGGMDINIHRYDYIEVHGSQCSVTDLKAWYIIPNAKCPLIVVDLTP
jgi:hypothetical protein